MNTRNQLGCCWVHAVPSTQCWAEEKITTEQLLNSGLCPADSSNWSLLMLIRRWSVADMYSHTRQMNDRRTSRAGGSARVCQVKVNKNRMQWFYKKYIHELWNNFKIMFLNIKIQLWISHHQQYMRYQDSEILERGQSSISPELRNLIRHYTWNQPWFCHGSQCTDSHHLLCYLQIQLKVLPCKDQLNSNLEIVFEEPGCCCF